MRAKGLRWRDISLIDHTLTIDRVTTKTDAGERVIPLNANATARLWSYTIALKRLAELSPPTMYSLLTRMATLIPLGPRQRGDGLASTDTGD